MSNLDFSDLPALNAWTDFYTWYDLLQAILNRRGIKFSDRSVAKDDYEMGYAPEEVADTIEDEYKKEI